MAEAGATDYLKNKFKTFQPLQYDWTPSDKLIYEANEAFDQASTDVDIGILEKFTALRMKELDKIINTNCYKNKEYNYLQAQKCEEYHMDNDYKLNLLNSFTRDHVWKYMVEYNNCYNNSEFNSIADPTEKDRAYLKCHEDFMKQWDGQIQKELHTRAKELFE